MSGHSKWHNIKIKKQKVDAKKGQAFTKITREIMMAAKEGGEDPDSNLRLRLAIQKAREVNMPKDSITRAIAKGVGKDKSDSELEEIIYEGYAPNGVALLIQVVTDNKNRTVSMLRNVLSKHGGALGESGCVRWMFNQCGSLIYSRDKIDEEELFLASVEAGADDVKVEGDTVEVITATSNLQKVKDALEALNYHPEQMQITMMPKTVVPLETKETAEKVLKLIEALEELEDVAYVYPNFDIPEEIMQKLN